MATFNGAMQHAGYLDKDGNLTLGAEEIFLLHREDVINKKSSLEFPCVVPEDLGEEVKNIDIRDKKKYYSFYKNWINGVYLTCLKILNAESNISLLVPPSPAPPGPMFDFIVLAEKLNKPAPPAGSASAIAAMSFVTPPPLNVIAAGAKLLVPPAPNPLFAEFQAGVASLPGVYIPPLADSFIPEVPSEEFPDLNYDAVPGSNLKDRQIKFYKAVIASLDSLVVQIIAGSPPLLNSLAVNFEVSLNALYSLSCAQLQQNFPVITNDNFSSAKANYAALQRSLTKPLLIAALAVIVGTSENSMIGQMGNDKPDPVKSLTTSLSGQQEQSQQQKSIQDINEELKKDQARKIAVPLTKTKNGFDPYGNFASNTTVEFRQFLWHTFKDDPRYKILNLDLDWLVSVMQQETAGTFHTAIRTGLAGKTVQYIPKKPFNDMKKIAESSSDKRFILQSSELIAKWNESYINTALLKKEPDKGVGVGLIQFTGFAVKLLKKALPVKYADLDLTKVSKMSYQEQIELVGDYFLGTTEFLSQGKVAYSIKSVGDLYIHVFAPGGIPKSDSYPLYTNISDVRDNSGFIGKTPEQVKEGDKILKSQVKASAENILVSAKNNGYVYVDSPHYVLPLPDKSKAIASYVEKDSTGSVILPPQQKVV